MKAKNKKKLLILVAIGIFFSSNQVFAHQPNLVWESQSTEKTPYLIEDINISQAFYGELKNKPEYYKVNIDKPSILYVGLLVPDNKNASKDLSLKIIKLNSPDSDIKLFLNGTILVWEKYYEPFAGDNYLKGPEETKYLRTGEYLIEVTSKDNIGKYSLVVGQEESFPLGKTIRMMIDLPKLKMVFFEEPFYMLYSGILGKLMTALFLFLLLLSMMSLRKVKESKMLKRKK